MSNFDRIFHNLLRHGDSSEESKRALEACSWLSDHLSTIRKISGSTEAELIGYIYNFWSVHKKAPSIDILKESIERKASSPLLSERITEYEELYEELAIHSALDLDQILADRVEEFESQRLSDVMKVVKQINSGSFEDTKTKKKLAGPKDAMRYLFQQVERGTLTTSSRNSSGSLNEDAGYIQDIYEKFKSDRLAGNLRVYTHIDGIDKHLAIKRGDFVGVLGYAGQRKSSLCRSIAYNSAMDGFNVLHITLEQTYEEELIIYGIIHSHHPKWGERFKISKRDFDDGNLKPEEEEFLFKTVIPDLKVNLPGKLLIRQPIEGTTWDSVKTTAEITNQTNQLDLLFVDYLTLCEIRTGRKEEMEALIKDAKQFALHFDSGRGVVFLTPVQGNRDGWVEAGKNEGRWEMNGVFQYSEFDKSVDTMLSVYMNDDNKADNQIIISSAKTRRSEGIPLFPAATNNNSGLVTNLHKVNLAEDSRIDVMMEEGF